jgi:arylsulfatase A-like enzyme
VNILLIQSDQHRYDCVGANGHPFLKTPNLDRLAREGVRFTQAYTPVPLCTPARNCLLYGCWPHQHLAICNYDTEAPRGARPELVSFSELLRDAGYELGYIGKWHTNAVRPPPSYGFSHWIDEAEYFPWREAQGLPRRPAVNAWFGESDPGITGAQSRLGWGAERVIEALGRLKSGGKPFFLRWDPSEPHLPNRVPPPYDTMYPREAIPPWPGFADTLEGKPFIQRKQQRTWGVEGWAWEKWSPIVQRYLGEITLMDEHIGRILASLDSLGLSGDTAVVYTSDHGDMCGSHGMMDKHYIMYDDVVRVPLVARLPGSGVAGTASGEFVSSGLDLACTFLDLAGVRMPDSYVGRSLVPALRGQGGTGRSCIVSTYYGNQLGLFTQRMVRERRWKYVWNATAEDELYDLESDPGELRNRAADPACAPQLTRLRGELRAWMKAERDPILNSWTEAQLEGPGIPEALR